MAQIKENFEELYHGYYPMVFQICLGYFKGEEDIAKDASQEVFIIIWKNLKKFKGESSIKTWIYRITVNTCLGQIKADSRREKALNQIEMDHQDENLDDSISKLYKAIGQLNKTERLIIMMVLEKEKQKMIAEILGIEETNLRVKIHRIKIKLGKILETMKDDR
ncbi:MAG: sigma-70 family RNA polymerase sigma factor [Saprospiraceae bacterium]|nr:sigma-70 family RNA polymerase sigma factor [Saprospiraceae bacterium]